MFESKTGQIARSIDGPSDYCKEPILWCNIWDLEEDDDSDPLGNESRKFWVFRIYYTPEGYEWSEDSRTIPEGTIRVDGPRHEHEAAKVVLLRFRELFPLRRFYSLNRLLQDESQIPDLIITAPDTD